MLEVEVEVEVVWNRVGVRILSFLELVKNEEQAAKYISISIYYASKFDLLLKLRSKTIN